MPSEVLDSRRSPNRHIICVLRARAVYQRLIHLTRGEKPISLKQATLRFAKCWMEAHAQPSLISVRSWASGSAVSGWPAEAWLGAGQDACFFNPSCQHRLLFQPVSALAPPHLQFWDPSQTLSSGYTELSTSVIHCLHLAGLKTTHATYQLVSRPSHLLTEFSLLGSIVTQQWSRAGCAAWCGLRAGQKGGSCWVCTYT